MADAEKQVKITLTAKDDTAAAFKQLNENLGKAGQAAKTTAASTNALTTSFADLVKAGLALFAVQNVLDFLKESADMAYDDEKATIRLEAAIENLGVTTAQVAPQVRALESSMRDFGYTGGETDKALTTLLRTTGSVPESMFLTQKAADLAASGMGDLQSNSEALAYLYTGRFKQAAVLFGIDMRENATAAEIFDAIMQKITITSDDMRQKQVVDLDEMRAKWNDFKGYLGSFVTWFEGNFADAMITTVRSLKDLFTGNIADMRSMLLEQAHVQERTDALTQSIKAYADQQAAASVKRSLDTKQAALDAEKAQEKLASDMEQSFRDVSKAVVSAVQDQEKAINDLHKSIQDIDDTLDEDLAKSQEKYQGDVADVARRAQSRIDEINKQIADENSAMSAGFRTRIEALQQEKAKEQAIIDKAGGVVSDLQAQLQEDDFDQLKAAHDKEVAEIQRAADEKKKAAQDEIVARQANVAAIAGVVGSPDFYSRAATEGTTFAGTIGAGGIQQVLNFTFNGDITGDDGIAKIKAAVIASLNRTATLNGVAGK